MRHSCIIIEDQLPAQRILQRYIEDVDGLQLAGTFTDPLAALEFLHRQPVDLLFLDIHLPKLSGLEFLKLLPYKPKVILTTAFSEYALAGYEYDVVDYLLKPISFERFMKAVSKILFTAEPTARETPAAESQEAPAVDFVFVKSDRAILKIEFDRIVYIKAEDDFTRVFTPQKTYFLSYTLKYWLDVLPAERFCQIHKSYIVNLRCIERIEGNQVYTSTDRLPIGRSFREEFMARIDLKA